MAAKLSHTDMAETAGLCEVGIMTHQGTVKWLSLSGWGQTEFDFDFNIIRFHAV